MGTVDLEKNKAYVAKHRAMKKANEETKKEYNDLNATYIKRHREVVKEKIGAEEYKKQQAEYMRQYRANLKQTKPNNVPTTNTITNAITIQSAIRNKLARNALLKAKQEKANELLTAINQERTNKDVNGLKSKLIASTVSNDIINNLFPNIINTIPIKRERGRPKLTQEQKQANKQARKQERKDTRRSQRLIRQLSN